MTKSSVIFLGIIYSLLTIVGFGTGILIIIEPVPVLPKIFMILVALAFTYLSGENAYKTYVYYANAYGKDYKNGK